MPSPGISSDIRKRINVHSHGSSFSTRQHTGEKLTPQGVLTLMMSVAQHGMNPYPLKPTILHPE